MTPTAEARTGPAPLSAVPSVSVIVPVLNEERHLRDAVQMILAQDYAGPLEVVLALGPSKDRTDEVAAQLGDRGPARAHRGQPERQDPQRAQRRHRRLAPRGHRPRRRPREIPPDYISTAVSELVRVGADNVGGLMDARGRSPFERAVACAMRSPLGVGNARFHVGGGAGEAETVYLGVFRRSALERVGGYDQHFARAQDWEMNHRIRESGGLVWFTRT